MDIVSDAALDHVQPIMVAVEGDAFASRDTPGVELDLSKFHSGRWALQLDAMFMRRTEPAIILAHGVACLAVAWWAQLSPRNYLRTIRGALFASPLKIDFGQSAVATSALAGPHCRLPFPSIVVSDAAAPYIEQVLNLADGWGSQFIDPYAAPSAHPSNRRAVSAGIEEMLLGYLNLLDRRAVIENAVAHDGFEHARLTPDASTGSDLAWRR